MLGFRRRAQHHFLTSVRHISYAPGSRIPPISNQFNKGSFAVIKASSNFNELTESGERRYKNPTDYHRQAPQDLANYLKQQDFDTQNGFLVIKVNQCVLDPDDWNPNEKDIREGLVNTGHIAAAFATVDDNGQVKLDESTVVSKVPAPLPFETTANTERQLYSSPTRESHLTGRNAGEYLIVVAKDALNLTPEQMAKRKSEMENNEAPFGKEYDLTESACSQAVFYALTGSALFPPESMETRGIAPQNVLIPALVGKETANGEKAPGILNPNIAIEAHESLLTTNTGLTTQATQLGRQYKEMKQTNPAQESHTVVNEIIGEANAEQAEQKQARSENNLRGPQP